MSLTEDFVRQIRAKYPALNRCVGDHDAAYFDGPGGTQVPEPVIDAVSHYLAHTNSNHGGLFPSSLESDAILAEAHQAMADFLGSDDAGTIIFGANMTTLSMTLARSLTKTWGPGDEIVVTRLDHDANVSTWVMAAKEPRC